MTGAVRTTEAPRAYGRQALLAEGFSLAQLREYRRLGLLPPAHGKGPNAHYTEVHLAILRRIKKAQDEHRSHADIREMVELGGTP